MMAWGRFSLSFFHFSDFSHQESELDSIRLFTPPSFTRPKFMDIVLSFFKWTLIGVTHLFVFFQLSKRPFCEHLVVLFPFPLEGFFFRSLSIHTT